MNNKKPVITYIKNGQEKTLKVTSRNSNKIKKEIFSFNDSGIVVLKKDGEVISLQSDFFGSVIGDQSRLGANTTSYPGTFIGKNTWIYPGTCIKGFIPSLKRVSNKSELCITDNKEYDLN